MFGSEELTVQCSRSGCQLPAVVELRWRNPKIHDETREKIWLACDQHQDYLREFLQARNFPVRVEPYRVEVDE